MVTPSDLEKWQKAIQGIEAGQKDLSSEELSAFQMLKELFNNGNFASHESGGYIKTIKDALPSHSTHRLLRVHLINFVALCEQSFTNKSVPVAQPSVSVPVSAPASEIKPQSPPVMPLPTFEGIPSEDIAALQKAIQGIEAGQKDLSREEWSAFEVLKENCCNGNFELGESNALIKVLKDALPSHSKHRMLQKVHLPKFIELCEKYFKSKTAHFVVPSTTDTQNNMPTFQPPVFQPPTIEPPTVQSPPVQPPIVQSPPIQPPRVQPPSVQPPIVQSPKVQPPKVQPLIVQKEKKPKGGKTKIILIAVVIALLIGGWQVYQNWNILFGKPAEIILDKPALSFENIGNSEQLTATILPADISEKNKKIIWQSSDTLVATVDANGVVTAIAPGSTLISVRTINELSATCDVTVLEKIIDVIDIKLDTTALTIEENATIRLTATVEPDDATDKTITWLSDDPEVATVDSTGLVTAVANGCATITATTSNGLSVICAVMVGKKIEVDRISLNETAISLKKGDTKYLAETVYPKDATDKSVKWSSENPNIATVSEQGLVTAQSEGTTIVTVETNDGNKTARCKVTVVPPVRTGTINYSFGKYVGEIVNDIPHGQGKMYYSCRIRIAKHGRTTHYAESGDTFVGTWNNGDIDGGNLYDKNNKSKGILAGKRSNPYDLKNDRCE